jgi:hypothetical protein
MGDKKRMTITIEFEVGVLAYSRGEKAESGKIISVDPDLNRIEIDLKNGYFWVGSAEDFFKHWEFSDIPF